MKAIKTSISLVLVGQFTPESFLPDKLAEGKVIARRTAESASFIALLPTQTVNFRFDWAELSVFQNRFQIISLEAPHIRICDFVLKALGDLAPNSIVSQFGINVNCHYDLGSVDARNNFGRRLAPPDVWGPWGQKLLVSMTGKDSGTPLQGGVINIQMRLPFAEDGLNGWRDVIVEPSLDIPNNTGVLLRSNQHHQLTSLDPNAEASEDQPSDSKTTLFLLTALSNRFEKSIEDAFSIFEGVIASS